MLEQAVAEFPYRAMPTIMTKDDVGKSGDLRMRIGDDDGRSDELQTAHIVDVIAHVNHFVGVCAPLA